MVVVVSTGTCPLPEPSGKKALKFPRKQLLFNQFVPNWRRLIGLASFFRAAFLRTASYLILETVLRAVVHF